MAKLTAADGAAYDNFGWSVAISDGTIVVGAYGDDDKGSDSGSVYLFEKSSSGDASSFAQVAKLTADDGAKYDQFGRSVAISDGTIVVGAYGDDDKGSRSGSAYLFQKSSSGDASSWAQGRNSPPPTEQRMIISVGPLQSGMVSPSSEHRLMMIKVFFWFRVPLREELFRRRELVGASGKAHRRRRSSE